MMCRALLQNGWVEAGSDCCGNPGSVVIYNGDQHAALSIGGGLIDQHNPSVCGGYGAWGNR
jgi:hypothetical protein